MEKLRGSKEDIKSLYLMISVGLHEAMYIFVLFLGIYYFSQMHGIEWFWLFISFTHVGLGALVGPKITKKFNPYKLWMTIITLQTITLILMALSDEKVVIISCFAWFGFLTGTINFVKISFYISEEIDISHGGRDMGTVFILYSIIMIWDCLMLIFFPIGVFVIFEIFRYFVILYLVVKGHKFHEFASQEPFDLKEYIRDKKNIAIFFYFFNWGFFINNIIFVIVLFFDPRNYEEYLPSFIAILFTTVLLLTKPVGYMIDKLGRKPSMIIGLTIQAGMFFSFSLVESNTMDRFLVYHFPYLLGIGFSFVLIAGYCLSTELNLTPENAPYRWNLHYTIIAMGWATSIPFVVTMQTIIADDLGKITTFLLFELFVSSAFIIQIPETKPPKDELEWRKNVVHVSIVLKSGITLFSVTMKPEAMDDSEPDETLLGGAIIAVNSILNEIVKNKEPLKSVQQDKFNIMIEGGQETLIVVLTLQESKLLRKKMMNFIDEFEFLFKDSIKLGYYNRQLYMPTTALLDKHFS